MEEKVEEYLRLIYSEDELKREKEIFNMERDRKFISENIEEINKKFEENKKIETDEETQDSEDKSNDEYIVAKGDNCLEENQNEADVQDNETNTEGEVAENNIEKQEDSKELLKNIINEIKINQYFALLHPEYVDLKEDEQYFVLDDKEIIRENIDAIDAYYQDCKIVGSGAQEMEWTDQMIIETALELFNKQEKIFTPSDIEQFSNTVKYEEFKQAITTIKEIANDEVEESTKEEG